MRAAASMIRFAFAERIGAAKMTCLLME